jgi:KDO2-lipid IV(A) lauroyltransferase
VIPFRRRVIDENLQTAFPDWTPRKRLASARAMWEHLFLMVCEMAHVQRKVHITNYREYFRFPDNGRRKMVRLLLDPRPLTIVSGHFGNFEVGSYATGLFGFPLFAVARPMDNPLLDRFFKGFRAAHGQLILPKHGSAKQIAAALDAGHTLAILGDQWAGPKGCWVDFFGRPTSCHKAIAVFPLSSGAPLVVSYAKRLHRPLLYEVGSFILDDPTRGPHAMGGVRELTQWYNLRLEEIIRRTPEQYWWLHRRWKGNRPRRALRRAA